MLTKEHLHGLVTRRLPLRIKHHFICTNDDGIVGSLLTILYGRHLLNDEWSTNIPEVPRLNNLAWLIIQAMSGSVGEYIGIHHC